MTKLSFCFCGIVSLLFACSSRTNNLSPIPEDKMVEILSELAMSEAHFKTLFGNDRDSMVNSIRIETLAKHGYNDSIFNLALEMVSRNEKDVIKIENEVIKHLEDFQKGQK
ncbi:MAG: DUF4296 domain-containing protein [Bacteroidota bacterium]|nr:DUF4296 domain-containing protein [Bacteroidota bacterium]